jgi:hypothetical protein
MLTDKNLQFIAATIKMYDMLDRNPELVALGGKEPDLQEVIANLFMKAAKTVAADLDDNDLFNAFYQALTNYMLNAEAQKNEEREKENEECSDKSGTTKSSVH